MLIRIAFDYSCPLPPKAEKSDSECCRTFLCKGYKKDIFAGFAYEFELLQFLVKYRLTPK